MSIFSTLLEDSGIPAVVWGDLLIGFFLGLFLVHTKKK